MYGSRCKNTHIYPHDNLMYGCSCKNINPYNNLMYGPMGSLWTFTVLHSSFFLEHIRAGLTVTEHIEAWVCVCVGGGVGRWRCLLSHQG